MTPMPSVLNTVKYIRFSYRVELRQFKTEVQQVLMSEIKVLRQAFDSQEIFWVCD
jgi:hypothetical protein